MSLLVLLQEAWRKTSQQYATFSAIIRKKEMGRRRKRKREKVSSREEPLAVDLNVCQSSAMSCP